MDNQGRPSPIPANKLRGMNISKGRKALSVMILSLLASVIVNAQATTDKVQMADGLRSSGKIYVVVAVLLTVLTGLLLYLVRLDKKITSLEKQVK